MRSWLRSDKPSTKLAVALPGSADATKNARKRFFHRPESINSQPGLPWQSKPASFAVAICRAKDSRPGDVILLPRRNQLSILFAVPSETTQIICSKHINPGACLSLLRNKQRQPSYGHIVAITIIRKTLALLIQTQQFKRPRIKPTEMKCAGKHYSHNAAACPVQHKAKLNSRHNQNRLMWIIFQQLTMQHILKL